MKKLFILFLLVSFTSFSQETLKYSSPKNIKSAENFIKKEAKQLKKDGWKIAKNLYYGKEEDRKEYFYQTIEEGLNDIYHKEMINNSYRLDSVGNFFLIGMGDAFSPIKVNGENYYINTEKVSLQYAYNDLGGQVNTDILYEKNSLDTMTSDYRVFNTVKIINEDTTYHTSIDSYEEMREIKLEQNRLHEVVYSQNIKTDDGRLVQEDYVSKSDKIFWEPNIPMQVENYSIILLHIDGTIALLESKAEEFYYKYISSIKRDFINEQNKDVRILMIERESDGGRKEVRTTIVKEYKN